MDFEQFLQTGRSRPVRLGRHTVEFSGTVKADGTIAVQISIPFGYGVERFLLSPQFLSQAELNPFTGQWKVSAGVQIEPFGALINFAFPTGRISFNFSAGTSGVWASSSGEVFVQAGVSNNWIEGGSTGFTWDTPIYIGKIENIRNIIPGFQPNPPPAQRELNGHLVPIYDLSNPDHVYALQQHTYEQMSEAARQGWSPAIVLPPRCFLSGTSIFMADGNQKNIENICIGDKVMAFDMGAALGRSALIKAQVTRIFRNTARTILDLRGLRMTPGHVCLSEGGRFETIAAILAEDGALVDLDGDLIRARTGHRLASPEDALVRVLYNDLASGEPSVVTVRAGIPCGFVATVDGRATQVTLAALLGKNGLKPRPDGTLQHTGGEQFEYCVWLNDASPFETAEQRNCIVAGPDGQSYVPEWIRQLEVEAADEAAKTSMTRTVATDQRATPQGAIGRALVGMTMIGSLIG